MTDRWADRETTQQTIAPIDGRMGQYTHYTERSTNQLLNQWANQLTKQLLDGPIERQMGQLTDKPTEGWTN